MSRLAPIRPQDATPEQRELFEAITGGVRGKDRPVSAFLDARGAMGGPFNAWMHRPDLGGIAHRLGERLRFAGRLSGFDRELAILLVARRYRAQYEWWAHARVARQEGMDAKIIETLLRGDKPSFEDAASEVVYRFVEALLADGRADDVLYREAEEALGDAALVELVTLAGYYTLVSFTLNVFDVELPDGEARPFEA